MKIQYKDLKERKNIVLWGAGDYLMQNYDWLDNSLDIIAVCDKNKNKIGQNYTNDSLICLDKNTLNKSNCVIIAVNDDNAIKEISEELNAKNIDYCYIKEALKESMKIKDYEILDKLGFKKINKPAGKMMKFIDCFVPIRECNLKCAYCYIGQNNNFSKSFFALHSPEYIRAALSQERMGGSIFINFCAGGETFLCEELFDIIRELLDEGHYIQIVTNGTITKNIDKFLSMGLDYSRIFIKFSLHYLEFKRLKMLELFSDNVKKIYDAGCSISIEVTPSDELIPFIDELKEYSLNSFGALPHITVARDERVASFKILSKLNIDDYKKTWSIFSSKMFEFKIAEVGNKRYEDCLAGLYSANLNLETGNLYKCAGNPILGNIYSDITKNIEFEKVGNKCCMPYCFNCHSYLTLGVIKNDNVPYYIDMRDRETKEGKCWIQGKMKEIFTQKLYINNN